MIVQVENCNIKFFVFILSCCSLLAVVQSSNECSICTENTKLTDLIEKFDTLQAEMKSQKTEINQLKSENEKLKAQLSQQGEKILLLEKEISQQKPFGPPNKSTDSCTKKVDNKAASKKIKKLSSVDLALLPKSCEELRAKGHFADGVYLLLNKITNKIDAVLCGFPGAKQVDETAIGTVELKTQSVHFNVQRDNSLDFATSTCNGCIPFEREVLNIGAAINTTTGSFTAPVTGTYHFEFSAIGDANLHLKFYNENNPTEKVAAPYSPASGTVSFTASLHLEKDEKMILQMESGGFSAGDDGPGILYTGWLLEEELL